MAFGATRSSRFTVVLLTLAAAVRALPVEKLAEPPFDAAQYKEYLSNLKCKEMQIQHLGVRVPEVATGTIYQESYSPPPPSPTSEVPTSVQTTAAALLTPTVPTTRPTKNVPGTRPPGSGGSSSNEDDKFPEYEDDVDKKKENKELPDHKSPSNVTTGDSGFLAGGNGTGASFNANEECTAPFSWEWVDYNWYQILLDNGGPPGAYLQKGLKSNLTKAVDPCSRPVLYTPPIKTETSFVFTHTEFEKIYRSEQVQMRFSGTPLEFVDITGRLIWSPPGSKRRYFHMSYRKDDTGLYFDLDRTQRCVFKSDPQVWVDCQYTEEICDCREGKETCFGGTSIPAPAAGIPAGLQAALVGGGR